MIYASVFLCVPLYINISLKWNVKMFYQKTHLPGTAHVHTEWYRRNFRSCWQLRDSFRPENDVILFPCTVGLGLSRLFQTESVFITLSLDVFVISNWMKMRVETRLFLRTKGRTWRKFSLKKPPENTDIPGIFNKPLSVCIHNLCLKTLISGMGTRPTCSASKWKIQLAALPQAFS